MALRPSQAGRRKRRRESSDSRHHTKWAGGGAITIAGLEAVSLVVTLYTPAPPYTPGWANVAASRTATAP